MVGPKIIFLFITGCVTCLTADTVEQIFIRDSKVPVKGNDIQVVCEVSQFTSGGIVSVYKTDSIPPADLTPTPSVVKCTQSVCLGSIPRHTFSTSSSGVTITVTNLNRSEDQKYWTCAISNQRKYMQLTVYTITSSLQYDHPPNHAQDLVQNSVTLRCSTGCAYPSPNFIWYYIKTNGSRQKWSTTTPVTNRTGDCTDSEKIYTSTLTLPRNTVFTDDTDTIVKFQCGAISETGAKYQLFTQTSVDIRFA
ncbi:uncharacterized protein LOC132727608, partial [Ruditapes philippinarum]|uniref:uncharacterized protein LOC132727608 n=1 Tax=Ruditapes philippinarum TaxID=129788 RepID=UPI00295B6035